MLKLARDILGPFLFLVLTFVVLFFVSLQPFGRNTISRGVRIYRGLGWAFNIRAKVLNENPTPEDKPVVYVCNHQSDLDMLIWSYMWPKNTAPIGKKELLYIPIFGLAYWIAGGIFIDRADKKKAWQVIDQMAEKIHSLNRSIIVFPEGTRSNGKGLLPFKKGAFSAAIKAQVPVAPIVFSSDSLVDRSVLSPRPALIEYMEPISTEGLTEDDAEALAQKCHDLMKAKIAELDDKVLMDEYNETLKQRATHAMHQSMEKARNYFHL